ncbi:MAG: transcriptional regulator [Rhodoferax sp.]|nr:transcriptional regulator [Rhodoferax sp.]
MEASVVAGVESSVESDPSGHGNSRGNAPALGIRMLGPLTISCGGRALPLPASRKARALVAFLALDPRPMPRTQLCELLWDLPNDPRGELRWCLSKIRIVLDSGDRKRVETIDDTIRLDLSDCFVDAIEIERACRQQEKNGGSAPGADRLRALVAMCAGDFLQGLEVARSPQFSGWLLAQRRHLRARHVALLEQLVACLEAGSEESRSYLEQWLALSPFDRRVHELLLKGFALRGQSHDGDEHLNAMARLFDAEGLDWRPLGAIWRAARAQQSGSVQPEPATATDRTPLPGFIDDSEAAQVAATGRASVAIMPFSEQATPGAPYDALAGGFAHDLITRLAKLRSLFVIAQGTIFTLHERKIGAQDAARTLNVDYMVSGSMQRRAGRLTVHVELSETRTARVLWADSFERKLDDAFAVLHEIGDGIVAAVASEIETAERNRAILKSPSSLDAWGAHHRGLWHMYRFNQADNDKARQCFELAVRLDPGFSRAFAGLSFTHWQDAFQRWADRLPAVERAFKAASHSLLADERDPAAHWAMGRALWLREQQPQSLVELETAVDLSPSFALGHYTLAFVHSQSGDPAAAISYSDHSRQLSPFDPLLFGMLGARAMALVRLGRFDEAADWAIKAADRPNAHVHILSIAAHCLALADRCDDAHARVAAIRGKAPGYRLSDFLSAFHFTDEAQALYRCAAKRIGID